MEAVRTYLSNDGMKRLSIFRDYEAESPRYMCDEPLHCEDFHRNYSIMTKKEWETRSENAADLLRYLLTYYADGQKVIEFLITNGKKKAKGERLDMESALVYNRSRKGYEFISTESYWSASEREDGWYEWDFFDGRKDQLDAIDIINELPEEDIFFLATDAKCMGDKIKMASYEFNYNGGVSFADAVYENCDGIAWIEKDEFFKWHTYNENDWNNKNLKEIEFLVDELEAWGDNDVFRFELENKVSYKVTKVCTSEDRETAEYDEDEWEMEDSCGGFYGRIDRSIESIAWNAGIKLSEYTEI